MNEKERKKKKTDMFQNLPSYIKQTSFPVKQFRGKASKRVEIEEKSIRDA